MNKKRWAKYIFVSALIIGLKTLDNEDFLTSLQFGMIYLIIAECAYVVGKYMIDKLIDAFRFDRSTLGSSVETFLITAPVFGYLMYMQRNMVTGVWFGIVLGLIVSGIHRPLLRYMGILTKR